MKYQSNVNEVQALILRQLSLRGDLRFSEVNVENLPSDQLSYHLRQLIKYGLVEKSAQNVYSLSVNGRSRAILLDAKSNRFIEQGFVACRIVLARDSGGGRQYLMQRRTRVPYTGRIAEPGGKVLYGEDVLTAAQRHLLAETGLECDLRVRGIVHFKDEYLGRIVQDKFFFVVLATNSRGDILPKGETSENTWMTLEEIIANPKTHQGVTDIIAMAEAGGFGFLESTHVTEEY
jgi:ADP-ribose pyrophosphatase YjhB (NUDIX family)